MIRSPRTTLPLALLAAFALAGCDSTTPSIAETRILLSQGSSTAGPAFSASLLPGDATVAQKGVHSMSVAEVVSIEIDLLAVEALREGDEEEDARAWVSFDLAGPSVLDLLALPTTPETGLLLARGDLPAGTYRNLRIRFGDATVTFASPVTVGQSTYPADEKIPLVVPSGPQTGIKVPGLVFTVAEDAGAEVGLVFDAEASVATIVPTGAGKVILSPVLKPRP
jgi:hypothetical protein